MRTKVKPTRVQALTRKRIKRFAADNNFCTREMAEIMDVPESTMQFWLTDTKNAKYPRTGRCCELNTKLDELGAATSSGKPVKTAGRTVQAKPVVVPLKLSNPTPVKPTTTEQELKWLVEGYRSEAIQGVTDELPYILERYRKGVNNG